MLNNANVRCIIVDVDIVKIDVIDTDKMWKIIPTINIKTKYKKIEYKELYRLYKENRALFITNPITLNTTIMLPQDTLDKIDIWLAKNIMNNKLYLDLLEIKDMPIEELDRERLIETIKEQLLNEYKTIYISIKDNDNAIINDYRIAEHNELTEKGYVNESEISSIVKSILEIDEEIVICKHGLTYVEQHFRDNEYMNIFGIPFVYKEALDNRDNIKYRLYSNMVENYARDIVTIHELLERYGTYSYIPEDIDLTIPSDTNSVKDILKTMKEYGIDIEYIEKMLNSIKDIYVVYIDKGVVFTLRNHDTWIIKMDKHRDSELINKLLRNNARKLEIIKELYNRDIRIAPMDLTSKDT